MNKLIFGAIAVIALSGCNTVYNLRPGTLDKSETVFADRGGFAMKAAIKTELEKRGFKVLVGRAESGKTIEGDGDDLEDTDMDVSSVPTDARYVVSVKERRERFAWYWCPFNGFWWWNFNVSVADQKTGKELLSWRGRGCENSSMRKLGGIIDKLEGK